MSYHLGRVFFNSAILAGSKQACVCRNLIMIDTKANMAVRTGQTKVGLTVLDSPGGPVVEGSGTAALGLGSNTSRLLRPQADTAGGAAGTRRCFCGVTSTASLSPALMQTLSMCHKKHARCQAGVVQLQDLRALYGNIICLLSSAVQRYWVTRMRCSKAAS